MQVVFTIRQYFRLHDWHKTILHTAYTAVQKPDPGHIFKLEVAPTTKATLIPLASWISDYTAILVVPFPPLSTPLLCYEAATRKSIE